MTRHELTLSLLAFAPAFAAMAGGPPPAPPGPEGWQFRKELAEDPPPDYPPPSGKPWLENRISRCFFSPIKRPPISRAPVRNTRANLELLTFIVA